MYKSLAMLTVALVIGGTALESRANPALAKAKNCLACHAMTTRLVGPSFKEVAAKYGTDDAVVDQLAEKIRLGSHGVWGPVPMPPNPQVSKEDAATLARWILSVR